MSRQSDRGRWVTFAEIVGVIGLLISGVSVWLAWSDHRAQQVEKASVSRDRTLVTFDADSEHGGASLKLIDRDHPVQRIEVRFPTALAVAPQTVEGQPRIKAEWFDHALLHATQAHEGRLPLLVTASYWDGTVERSDAAIYDVVWRSTGRLFRGRTLRLDGLALRQRGGTQARVDAMWKAAAK
jgi:hypothetical protein